MQLTQGHFALQLCEIGELRRHVGRGVDRVFRLFSWSSFKSIYVTASKRIINANNYHLCRSRCAKLNFLQFNVNITFLKKK